MASLRNTNFSGEVMGLIDDQEEIFYVTIKFDSNKTCMVCVKKTTTITEVKELAGKESQLVPSSINLVFAGQLLEDNKTVEDYNLEGQTTLHALCQPRGTSVQETSGSVLQSSSGNQGHNRFFVYCKVCDYVCPGKLRVCCRLCESSLFVVEQGPSDWEDISTNTTIRGVCKNQGCNGTIPRFYMKCCQSHELAESEREGTVVVLKHVQANRERVGCIICQEIVSPVLIFPCPPRHVICLECFREYALTSLNSRQFVEHEIHGYTLPCPADGCGEFHIEDNHHFYLMGKNEYERFKNFGAEECVLKNGGVLCPGPNCGMGFFSENDDSRIQCTECQFVSCRHCKREYHFGSCDENLESELTSINRLTVDRERAQRTLSERQSLTLIGEISKACPECKVKTQHSGGCLHMTCTRCHTDWCWLCVKPWSRQCQEDHWFG